MTWPSGKAGSLLLYGEHLVVFTAPEIPGTWSPSGHESKATSRETLPRPEQVRLSCPWKQKGESVGRWIDLWGQSWGCPQHLCSGIRGCKLTWAVGQPKVLPYKAGVCHRGEGKWDPLPQEVTKSRPHCHSQSLQCQVSPSSDKRSLIFDINRLPASVRTSPRSRHISEQRGPQEADSRHQNMFEVNPWAWTCSRLQEAETSLGE